MYMFSAFKTQVLYLQLDASRHGDFNPPHKKASKHMYQSAPVSYVTQPLDLIFIPSVDGNQPPSAPSPFLSSSRVHTVPCDVTM